MGGKCAVSVGMLVCRYSASAVGTVISISPNTLRCNPLISVLDLLLVRCLLLVLFFMSAQYSLMSFASSVTSSWLRSLATSASRARRSSLHSTTPLRSYPMRHVGRSRRAGVCNGPYDIKFSLGSAWGLFHIHIPRGVIFPSSDHGAPRVKARFLVRGGK
jgi:hypothetical protein